MKWQCYFRMVLQQQVGTEEVRTEEISESTCFSSYVTGISSGEGC